MDDIGSAPIPALDVIHWGRFSGTVPMLGEALTGLTETSFRDLGTLTRSPNLLGARVRAAAVGAMRGVPWHKTTPWSRGLQRHMTSEGWLAEGRPALFMQTLAAAVLPERYRYAIYTDRVAMEGAAGKGPYSSTWGPGWAERERSFLMQAEAVFVMGPSTRNALVDGYGLPDDRVHLAGAGPGTHIGPVHERTRCRRLLFVGTQWGLKGGPEVVEAFSRLVTRRPDLELTLAGSDPELTSLPPNVTAIGRIPAEEMPSLFAAHDLFVVPTYMEALGYSLLEALMQGLPAIGSTVGNQPWLIGEAGLTVEPGDVDALESALESVIASFESFGHRAAERAVELRRDMNWDSVARRIVNVFLAVRD